MLWAKYQINLDASGMTQARFMAKPQINLNGSGMTQCSWPSPKKVLKVMICPNVHGQTSNKSWWFWYDPIILMAKYEKPRCFMVWPNAQGQTPINPWCFVVWPNVQDQTSKTSTRRWLCLWPNASQVPINPWWLGYDSMLGAKYQKYWWLCLWPNAWGQTPKNILMLLIWPHTHGQVRKTSTVMPLTHQCPSNGKYQ